MECLQIKNVQVIKICATMVIINGRLLVYDPCLFDLSSDDDVLFLFGTVRRVSDWMSDRLVYLHRTGDGFISFDSRSLSDFLELCSDDVSQQIQSVLYGKKDG